MNFLQLFLIFIILLSISSSLVSMGYHHKTTGRICRRKSEKSNKINPFKSVSKKSRVNQLPLCSLRVDDFVVGRLIPGTIPRSSPFPPWLNISLARRGQLFARDNFLGVGLCAFVGLVVGLPVPDELEIISMTGNTDSLAKASRRYLATAAQFQVWLETLFKSELGDDAIVTSIRNVRELHLRAAERASIEIKNRRQLIPDGKYDNFKLDDVMWTALATDLKSSNLKYRSWPGKYDKYNSSTVPVNQYIQGLTLMGFMGFLVIDPNSVFIWKPSREDLISYVHLWGVLGWMFGIDDEFNPCLQPDLLNEKLYLRELYEKYVFPAWFQISRAGKVHVEAILNDLNNYIPMLGLRPMMFRILRDYFQIDAKNLWGIMRNVDKYAVKRFDNRLRAITRNNNWSRVLGQTVHIAIDSAIGGMFGPWITPIQKARNVLVT